MESEENKANPIHWIIYVGVLVSMIGPLLPQFVWPFAKSWFFPDLIPSAWSVRAWQYIGNPNNQVLEAVWNSLVIAVIVMFISVILGVPAGRALGMYRFRGKGIVELFILAPSIDRDQYHLSGAQSHPCADRSGKHIHGPTQDEREYPDKLERNVLQRKKNTR